MITRISLITFFIAALMSCKQHENNAEIAKIDSLNVQLDSIQLTLDNIDSSKIHNRLNLQLAKLNEIQKTMDSITKPEALIIDEYGRYKRSYSKWYPKFSIFYDEIALRKKQMRNLKKDLEKDLIEQQDISVFYSKELMHIQTLNEVINQMKEGLNSIEEDYMQSSKRIDSLLQMAPADTVQ